MKSLRWKMTRLLTNERFKMKDYWMVTKQALRWKMVGQLKTQKSEMAGWLKNGSLKTEDGWMNDKNRSLKMKESRMVEETEV